MALTSPPPSSAVDPFLSPHARDYGPAAFNRSHVFNSYFYYSLPKPDKTLRIRPLGWVTDNWELSGVVRMLTGAPLTPGYNLISGIATPTGSASEVARMQVADPNSPLAQRFGPPPEPAGQASLATAPWSVAGTAPQLGNLGKNTITGPRTNNWAISLYRRLKFTERITGQFRLETYNTFNHTQFSAINSTAQFDTKAQQVNSGFLLPIASRPPRRVQLAFRLMF
jgi:hypothetical protein